MYHEITPNDACKKRVMIPARVNGKLPLDGSYESFPFLLFRCDNFIATRQQQFDRRYLFSSTGFNLINLILSQK